MCRQTLSSRIAQKFIDTKAKLTESFFAIQHFCTTADAWKARGRAYLGVTAHYLCPATLKRESVCLAIRRIIGSITYDVIAKQLDSIHTEYGIENKVRVTVTDIGSNFLKAFQVFGPSETDQDEECDQNDYDDSTIVRIK